MSEMISKWSAFLQNPPLQNSLGNQASGRSWEEIHHFHINHHSRAAVNWHPAIVDRTHSNAMTLSHLVIWKIIKIDRNLLASPKSFHLCSFPPSFSPAATSWGLRQEKNREKHREKNTNSRKKISRAFVLLFVALGRNFSKHSKKKLSCWKLNASFNKH